MKKKVKIVVVSLFSNIDLFLKAFVKLGALPGFACEINKWPAWIHAANFKYPDGTPVLTPCVEISDEELEALKALGKKEKRSVANEWWEKDGKNYRNKKVQEINGAEIRQLCEKIYGPDIKIILIGGPPCTDMSKLNRTKNRGRTALIFEFLRVLKELDPDVVLMEEAKELQEENHKDTFDEYIKQAKLLPYKIAYMLMNAIHYGVGKQLRARTVVQLLAERLSKLPVFPEAEEGNAKRVGELIDVDHWFSGHFTDKIRTGLDYMTTVTSGSPLWLSKNGIKRSPTFDEKMMFMGAEKGDFILPDGLKIPERELSLAAGNGVCMNLGGALASTIIRDVLGLKYDGDGYFVPIDNDTDSSPDNDDSGSPIDTPTEPLSGNGRTDMPSSNPFEPSPDNGSSGAPIDTAPHPSDKGNADLHIDTLSELLSDTADTVTSVDILMPVLTNISADSDVSTEAIMQSEIPKISTCFQSSNPSQIISSQQLQLMNFDTLCFEGRWHTLLGDTSLNFFCVIHGLPGHGKSTFAIQLAKYLADNFGKTIYISGEEGFSKTFKDKFINSNAASILLDVADLRTYEDIVRVVPAESYRFIFIDSLDNMKINATKMKAIRAKFKNAALITISQSTKGGQMRGSQEIIHDSDIAIEVVNLLATTTKNRFKEKGMTYEVFPETEDTEYTEIE